MSHVNKVIEDSELTKFELDDIVLVGGRAGVIKLFAFLKQVYKGEISHPNDYRLLRTFDLSRIPLDPRGTAQIDVTFKVDANDILNMKAEDTAFSKQENITITSKKDRLSLRKIECMVYEAEDYTKNDKKKYGPHAFAGAESTEDDDHDKAGNSISPKGVTKGDLSCLYQVRSWALKTADAIGHFT
nr:luminal-binding protein 5-like [Tanacetum cinerariifolium]